MSAVAHYFVVVSGSKIHERAAHFFIDIYNYDALIEKNIFYIIENEKGKYLADTQQLFNFEMLHATRAYDRERKNNDSAESNPKDTTIETTNPPVTPAKGVAPDEPICDLPNDEADPFDW